MKTLAGKDENSKKQIELPRSPSVSLPTPGATPACQGRGLRVSSFLRSLKLAGVCLYCWFHVKHKNLGGEK